MVGGVMATLAKWTGLLQTGANNTADVVPLKWQQQQQGNDGGNDGRREELFPQCLKLQLKIREGDLNHLVPLISDRDERPQERLPLEEKEQKRGPDDHRFSERQEDMEQDSEPGCAVETRRVDE